MEPDNAFFGNERRCFEILDNPTGDYPKSVGGILRHPFAQEDKYIVLYTPFANGSWTLCKFNGYKWIIWDGIDFRSVYKEI